MLRDPRIDPMPGDVLRKGRTAREVTFRSGSVIRYFGPLSQVHPALIFVMQWRKWAKDAEVLQRGEERG
jgi:hypothetical protein